ncbi:MAG TPA: MHYT domain-containing protein, partial [Terriglobales bacterium]|nr:MHYT domain-containing protein [Terriglobales bacterium]
MLRVLTCITQEHDLRLVVLAGLICLFACYTGFSLIARVRSTAPQHQLYWIAAAAFATGGGVWATHFIAMLAFQPNLPSGYDIDITLFSIAVAVAFSGLGFWIANRGGRRHGLIGGAIAGAGISAMHYTGMAAYEVPGQLAYSGGMVVASLIIGIALGTVALDYGLRHPGLKGRWIAAA